MSFKDFPEQQDVVQLLQRSLAKGRLGHAYLFSGTDLDTLGAGARTLAKTLNCENPPARSPNGLALDCCDSCLSCRKIEGENHPDVRWVRPESKSRVITIDQMRELMQTVHLKPTQAAYKVSIIVAADRLNVQAANAFLKTLEEPPADSILVLLSTESHRILETIISRCLRLNFAGESSQFKDPIFVSWLTEFGNLAAETKSTLLGKYKLLSLILNRLNGLKDSITESLEKRSPLETATDIEPSLREKWEEELKAAIEAEYRKQRAELLAGLQWWMRDVWLLTLRMGQERLSFPQLSSTAQKVAQRVSTEQAVANLEQLEKLQRLLATNVQEALALEVGLLNLKM
jgi:DNA polymerase III subunit delta'